MALLEERTISGKGVLKVPDGQGIQEARIITLYVSVLRRPENEYLNFAYNPPRSRYATLNFFRETFLLRSVALEFPSQSWDFYPELNFQNLYALDCVYEGILQTFVNLGNALNLVPISVNNSISLYRHTDLWFDEIKVVCYADAAIQLRLESKPYDFCPEQTSITPDPPPSPPSSVDSIPPGTPLGGAFPVSPPYDANTSDNGDTQPYVIDAPQEPQPEGNSCQVYPLRLLYESLLNDGVTWNPNVTNPTVYGEYILQPILIPVDGNPQLTREIQMPCRGQAAPGLACQPFGNYQIRNLFPPGAQIRNVSIELR